jgi:hypothetical protein
MKILILSITLSLTTALFQYINSDMRNEDIEIYNDEMDETIYIDDINGDDYPLFEIDLDLPPVQRF